MYYGENSSIPVENCNAAEKEKSNSFEVLCIKRFIWIIVTNGDCGKFGKLIADLALHT